jgi:polysaccharide biosynthesis/export protein
MLIICVLFSTHGARGEELPLQLADLATLSEQTVPSPSARIVSVVERGSGSSSNSPSPPRLRRPVIDDQVHRVSLKSDVTSEKRIAPLVELQNDEAKAKPRGIWMKRQRRASADRVPPLVLSNEKALPPVAQPEPPVRELPLADPTIDQNEVETTLPAPGNQADSEGEESASPTTSIPHALPEGQAELPPKADAMDGKIQPATHKQDAGSSLVVPNTEGAPPSRPRHIIQLGDELEIAFPYQPVVGETTIQRLQTPIFRTERVIVREDGMIALPLIEPVQAAGLTPEEVRALLIESYLPHQYDPLANLNQGISRVYRICVNDEIDIRVRNQPDLDDIVTVRPDGKISVPRVGSVVVEGKTIEEIESELKLAIAEVVPQPEVSVSLRQFHSDIFYEGKTMKRMGLKNLEGISVIVRSADRQVYVMGEVKGAGQVTYRGTLSLSQAIASAGGTLRTARLKEVKVVRQTGPQQPPQTILVDFRSTIRGRGVQDMELQHLDVVVVGKTPIARFTDTLEQYLFNIVPFTRNNPNFNLFYSLGGGASAAGLVTPNP